MLSAAATYREGLLSILLAIVYAALALPTRDCVAQGQVPESAPANLAPVTVNGSRDAAAAADPISRTVVNSAEIARFSDTVLSDVMRRIPGVTITENRGRQAEVRLQGLSGAYTQILLNGQRVPNNFSIDSIPPQTIERIEIVRTALAESSGEGIAGTINIVLKQAPLVSTRDLKVDAGAGGGYTGAASGTVAFVADGVAQSIALAAKREKVPRDATIVNSIDETLGDRGRWTTRRRSDWVTSELSIVPSRRTTLDGGGFLLVEGMALSSYQRRLSKDQLTVDGALTATPQSTLEHTGVWRSLARLNATRSSPVGDGTASVETRAGVSYSKRTSRADVDFLDQAGEVASHRRLSYPSVDVGATASVKYSVSMGDSHAIATGLDTAGTVRKEDDTFKDDSGQESTQAKANVTRLAAYFQDEMSFSRTASLYLGARGETVWIRTTSGTQALRDTSEFLFSPTIRLTWRPEGSKTDSYRVGLSQSHKLPGIFDLSPRRYYANYNSALNPDSAGDPDLPIERSLNFDASAQARLNSGDDVSVSVSYRRVRDAVGTRLVEGADGRWLYTPAVGGNARITSLDLGYKTTLRLSESSVLLNSSLSRNWSRASWISAPNNHFADTIPLSATLLAEYALTASKTKFSANLSYQKGGTVALTNEFATARRARTLVDLSVSRPFAPGVDIRFSVINATNESTLSASSFRSVTRYEFQELTYDSVRSYRLSIAAKL